MDVFEAFPNAIVSGVWQLCEKTRNTITGKAYTASQGFLDVIIDEETEANHGEAPQADYSEADTLLYLKPSQLPTTNPNALQSDYLLLNSESGDVYDIIRVGLAKNQETGTLEHVEVQVRQTEATDE